MKPISLLMLLLLLLVIPMDRATYAQRSVKEQTRPEDETVGTQYTKGTAPVEFRGVKVVNGDILTSRLRPTNRVARVYPGGRVPDTMKIAVLLMTWSDSGPIPVPRDTVAKRFFGDSSMIRNCFMDVSYGKMEVVGEVFGWMEFGVSYSAWSSTSSLSGKTDSIFSARFGYDPAKYDYVAELENHDIGYAGLGTVNKTDLPGGDCYINYTRDAFPVPAFVPMYFSSAARTIVHELGHNLGLSHANLLTLADTGVATSTEYGFRLDPMGGGGLQHFNAMSKERLGWIDSTSMLSITKTGTYTIKPLERNGRFIAAKIKPLDVNDFGFYIEYRRPIGYDLFLDRYAGNDGIIVTCPYWYAKWKGAEASTSEANSLSFVLDLDPNEDYGYSLSGNNTFTDSTLGVTIGPIESVTPDSITFAVTLNHVPNLIAWPIPVSPFEAEAGNTNVRFTWHRVAGATSYDLRVDDFSRVTIHSIQVTDSTVVVPSLPLDNSFHRYWYVRANSAQGTTAWSDPVVFWTRSPVPGKTALIGPVVGSAILNTNIQFTWRSAQNAEYYYIYVGRDSLAVSTGQWQLCEFHGRVLDTTKLLSRLSYPGSRYYWMIQVLNSRSNNLSQVGSFEPVAQVPNNAWSIQVSGTNNTLWGVSFADANTGIAVGEGGTILKTVNGGLTWTAQNRGGETDPLYAVSLPTRSSGSVVGPWGRIFLTSDEGTTWNKQSGVMDDGDILQGVSTLGDGSTIAVGYRYVFVPSLKAYGTAFRTTDGGATWERWSSTTAIKPLSGVVLAASRTGIAVGSEGMILRTIDGGSSWFMQRSGTSRSLSAISLSDANTGTVVGDSGTILRTTDGGESWVTQISGTLKKLRGVAQIDSKTCVAVGDSGTILRTTDGGGTWLNQESGCVEALTGVSFSNAHSGTVVGAYGLILHTTNGGTSVGELAPIIPSEYTLFQNYPNPFNPSTTIRYALPHAAHVTLAVFNTLGQQVSVLQNGVVDAGHHEVRFDASVLPSGVYFYRMQAGNYVESRKLLLLK
jgi:photosystem II stability/assembly factor-like uncharacterized protein